MLESSNWVRPGWHAMGPILTALGVLALILSPVGYRLGWFGVPMALLRLIPLGLGLCALGLVVSLIALVLTPAGIGWPVTAAPWVAVVASIAVCIIPVLGILHARQVPRIHDITTDTDLPPTFVALAADRRASPNGLDYAGPEVAAAQKAAYPDLKTLFSKLSPDALFARALQAARDAGWKVAEANPKEGRIEAVDTTLLYGFKDDVVIVVRSDVDGSRLDMRSVSRVGQSDLGVNAARIRSYLARLTQQTQ